jgi:hypothetical protein
MFPKKLLTMASLATVLASTTAEPRQQRLNPPSADTLLIIGTANNGASSQFSQLNAFGNGRLGSVVDPVQAFGSTPDLEWALADALKSRQPMTDLKVAAEANYFPLNKAEYFMPVTVKISGAQLPDSGHARRIFLDIIGEVNQDGVVVQKLREEVDVRLSDEMARVLPMQQIAYDTGFTLFPGRYSIKFLVHDWNTRTHRNLSNGSSHSEPVKGRQ